MLAKHTFMDNTSRFRAAIVSGALFAAFSIICVLLTIDNSFSIVHPSQAQDLSSIVHAASSPRVAGQWHVLPPVTNENLREVSMVSSSDGWAVGNGGTLLRYNGTAWQVVNLNTTATLVDVYMLGANNGYIVGWTDNGSEIFHYNGTSWTSDYVTGLTLNSVHASSANNVWVVGLNTSVHWNGAQWSLVPVPFDRTLFAVQVPSDNEAWAFGNFEPISGRGLILQNTSGTWAQFPSSAPQTTFDASFTAPDDGWAVGTFITTTHVHHYDGTRWTWVYTNSLGLFDLNMLTPTDGWATGQSQSGPTIAHLYSGTFVTVTNPLPRVFLNGLDMLTPYEGWIVGEEGATLYYSCPLTFSDVQPADYFYEPVHYLNCADIVSGFSDNTFRPDDITTRAQVAKILALAEAWQMVCPPTPTYTDVPISDPFYCYIETATAHGAVSGYSNGSFRPGNTVTRGQLARMVVQAEGWNLNTVDGPHFSDVSPLDPFYPYVETAYNRGIISGYTDGTFRPANNATRGQVSKLVYNAMSVLTFP